MRGYLAVAGEAAADRETHRLSEADFLRLSNEPGTVVLDFTASANYVARHIPGAWFALRGQLADALPDVLEVDFHLDRFSGRGRGPARLAGCE